MKTIKLLSIFSVFALFFLAGCKEDNMPTTCSIDCEKEAVIGDCKAAIQRFYYDKAEKKCKEFTWGGCGDFPFETLEACETCDCSS